MALRDVLAGGIEADLSRLRARQRDDSGFLLAASHWLRYHLCTCYEEPLSAPNSCHSLGGRFSYTLSGVEGTSELSNTKSSRLPNPAPPETLARWVLLF